MASKQNNGFTLVELVVVIIILGIISVIAIPKFINLQDDAQRASIKGQFAAFDSAVKLYHSLWLTGSHQGRVENLANYGDGTIDSSPTGYPWGVDAVYSPDTTEHGQYFACIELWQGLTDNSTTAEGTDQDNHIGIIDSDIGVTYTTDTCIYVAAYFVQNKQDTLQMVYNHSTGDVEVNNAAYESVKDK